MALGSMVHDFKNTKKYNKPKIQILRMLLLIELKGKQLEKTSRKTLNIMLLQKPDILTTFGWFNYK
jgi:hypothetical protein